MTEINARSEGQSKQIVIGVNKGVVNTGDPYEVQREVLALGVERWRPQRDKKINDKEEEEIWVDRTHYQIELKQRIEASSEHLVEVVAAGGFGKSLLADWAYEQTRTKFTKPLWLNCRNQPSFNAISRQILLDIGLLIRDDATPNEFLVNELATWLTETSALVVLDQLEAVTQAEDWPAFAAFLKLWESRGTRSMVVLTTRQPVLSNSRYRLDLGGFSAAEGAAYLHQQEIDADQADLEALSELGQGHPYLLKFSASWLQETAEGRLDARGLDFFKRLFQQSRDDTGLATQLTTSESQVEQIFQVLLTRLVPQRRELLLALSVYRKPFSLLQVQAMAVQATEADLQILTERGFLLAQEHRWTLHPLVKTLVNAELQATGQAVAAHQQAVTYFAEQLQAETVALEDVLECFYHHVQLRDYSAAYAVIVSATEWLDRQGLYQTLVNLYGQLVTAWQAHAPSTAEVQRQFANSLGNLGNAYRALGEYRRAVTFHEQALAIKQSIGTQGGEAVSLSNLGAAYFSLGEYRRSVEFHEQALAITQSLGDRRGEANSLGHLGLAYASLAEYRRAIKCHEQHYEMAQSMGDRRGESTSLGNLGAAYASLGEYRRAIEFHEQALAIKQSIGDQGGEAASLSNLGSAHFSLA